MIIDFRIRSATIWMQNRLRAKYALHPFRASERIDVQERFLG